MNKFITLLLIAIALQACVIETSGRVRYREIPTSTTVYVESEPQAGVAVYSGCDSYDHDYAYSLAHCSHGTYEFVKCSAMYIRPYCMTDGDIQWDFQRCDIVDICEAW